MNHQFKPVDIVLPSTRRSTFRTVHHSFPTAAEYDLQFRKRQSRMKVYLILGVVFVVSVLIAISFKKKTPVDDAPSGTAGPVQNRNYDVLESIEVPEIQANLVVYRHKNSNTEVLTLIPSDSEQDAVFGLSFKTLAENDSGAANVLMRAVWDGSENYPLKSPIEELKKGSLQTYLSSKTFSDRTTYCAASRNLKDFQNLMTVMLDGVFNPLFVKPDHKWIFRQEGWRLEHKDRNSRALQFNGVTLNQMKGIYDDPDQLIARYSRRSLMNETHYKYEAQGMPGAILNLTNDQVIEFYHKYYHPSNAQVFLFGPSDYISKGLKIVDSYVGSTKARPDIEEAAEVHWQPFNLDSPAEEVHSFPSIVEDGNYHVMITWLINDHPLERRYEFAWQVIEYLLLGTPDSILRRALESSTIGTEVIGGLDRTHQQWTFSVGMKGVYKKNVNALEDLIQDTLQKIVDGPGFTDDEHKAALNTVEMRIRDQSTGDLPRGVVVFYRLLQKWNYGVDPKEALAFSDAWVEFKLWNNAVDNANSNRYFTLLRKHVVENTHRCHAHLFPRRGFAALNRVSEIKTISSMRRQKSKEDFTKIIAESVELEEIQKKPDLEEALALIPRLSLDEIDTDIMPNTIDLNVNKDILVGYTEVVSSFEMLYIDFGLNLADLEVNDIFLLPLVFRLMLTSGTKQFLPEQLQLEIGKASSGISTEYMIEDVKPRGDQGGNQYNVFPGTNLATMVFFRGRCMAIKLPDYLTLLSEIIFQGRVFEHDLVVSTLKEMNEEFMVRLADEGHLFAQRRLEARYSIQGMIQESLHGIHAFKKLQDMMDDAAEDYSALIARLESVRSKLIAGNRNGMILSVTGEPHLLLLTKKYFNSFVEDQVPRNDKSPPFIQSGKRTHPWVPQLRTEQNNLFPLIDEGIIIPSTVSSVGQGGRVYEVNEPVSGSSSVVAQYIEDGYLFREVEVERGAEKAYAFLNFRHGTLYFVSFRDPNVASTLEVYEDTKGELSRTILNRDELPDSAHEAILATIAKLDGDAPQPDEIGWEFLKEFIRDDNSDYRQKWRDEILGTTRSDFVDFINKFLEIENPSIVVLGPKDKFDETMNTTKIRLQLLGLD